jgi:hypothetical protein
MSDFSTIQKTAEQMQEEFNRVASEFQEKMRSMFTDMTKSFFEAAPEIKAVVWNQYTPYFNDGEECVFSIGDLFFLKEFDPSDLMDAYNYEGTEYEFETDITEDNLRRWKNLNNKFPHQTYSARISKIENLRKDPRNIELASLCKSFHGVIKQNEDLMEAIFGDHVTVYLTPGKSFAEEYSHD